MMACSATQALPVAGEVTISNIDGMRLHYVPAGKFNMGNDNGWAGQKPAHEVDLDAFWIDETEVTNRMYALCVQAGACLPPQNGVHTRAKGTSLIRSMPITQSFMSLGKMLMPIAYGLERALPSEAQWEKAARGNDDRPILGGTKFLKKTF